MFPIKINKKVFLTTSIIVVIVGSVAMVWLWHANCTIAPTAPVNSTSTAAVEGEGTSSAGVDTSDWETYRSEEWGFEVKYPKEWHRSQTREDIIPLYLLAPPTGISPSPGSLSIRYMPNQSANQVLSSRECEVLIGNVKGYTNCDTSDSIVSKSVYRGGASIDVIHNNKVLQIYWYDDDNINERGYNDFKNIIQTIKFDE